MEWGLGGVVITALAQTKFLFQITIKSINFSDMLNDVLKFYFFYQYVSLKLQSRKV